MGIRVLQLLNMVLVTICDFEGDPTLNRLLYYFHKCTLVLTRMQAVHVFPLTISTF